MHTYTHAQTYTSTHALTHTYTHSNSRLLEAPYFFLADFTLDCFAEEAKYEGTGGHVVLKSMLAYCTLHLHNNINCFRDSAYTY